MWKTCSVLLACTLLYAWTVNLSISLDLNLCQLLHVSFFNYISYPVLGGVELRYVAGLHYFSCLFYLGTAILSCFQWDTAWRILIQIAIGCGFGFPGQTACNTFRRLESTFLPLGALHFHFLVTTPIINSPGFNFQYQALTFNFPNYLMVSPIPSPCSIIIFI